jgi:hypothetical protein
VVADLVRGQEPAPGRGQLDRQRQPLQAVADLGDHLGVAGGQLERRVHRLGAVDEKGHGRDLRQFDHVRDEQPPVGPPFRHGQRRRGELPLAADVEGDPTRRQHLEVGAAGQQLRDLRRRRDEPLHVVQNQQPALVRQRQDQAVERRTVGGLRQLEPAGDRQRHEVGIDERREVDEVDAGGEVAAQIFGDGERQAGLADPARTDQGHEAERRLPQQIADGRDLPIASQQRRERDRQVQGVRLVRRHRVRWLRRSIVGKGGDRFGHDRPPVLHRPRLKPVPRIIANAFPRVNRHLGGGKRLEPGRRRRARKASITRLLLPARAVDAPRNEGSHS